MPASEPHGLKLVFGETTYYISTPVSVEHPVYDDSTGELACSVGYNTIGENAFLYFNGSAYAAMVQEDYGRYYTVYDINYEELYTVTIGDGTGVEVWETAPEFEVPEQVQYPDSDGNPCAGTADYNAMVLRVFDTEDTSVPQAVYTVVVPLSIAAAPGRLMVYDSDWELSEYTVESTMLGDGILAYKISGTGNFNGCLFVPEGRSSHFFKADGNPAGYIDVWEAGVPEAYTDAIEQDTDHPLPENIVLESPFTEVQGFARWLGKYAHTVCSTYASSPFALDDRLTMLANTVLQTPCYTTALVQASLYELKTAELADANRFFNQPYNTVRTVTVNGITCTIRRGESQYEIHSEAGELAYTMESSGDSFAAYDTDGELAFSVTRTGDNSLSAASADGSVLYTINTENTADTSLAEHSLTNAWDSGIIYSAAGEEIGTVSLPVAEPDPYDAWQSLLFEGSAPLFRENNAFCTHIGEIKYTFAQAANAYYDLDITEAGSESPVWHTVRLSQDNAAQRQLLDSTGADLGTIDPSGVTVNGTLAARPAELFEQDSLQVYINNTDYRVQYFVRTMGVHTLLDTDGTLVSFCMPVSDVSDENWELRNAEYELTGSISSGAYTPAGESSPSLLVQSSTDSTANLVSYDTGELTGRLFERIEITEDRLHTPAGFMRILSGGEADLYWKSAEGCYEVYDKNSSLVYTFTETEDGAYTVTDAAGEEAATVTLDHTYKSITQPYYEYAFELEGTVYSLSTPYASDRIDDYYLPSILPVITPGFERELLGITEDTQAIVKSDKTYLYTDEEGETSEGTWQVVANSDGTLAVYVFDSDGAVAYLLTTTSSGTPVYVYDADGLQIDTLTWETVTSNGHTVRYKIDSTRLGTWGYTYSAMQPEGSFSDTEDDEGDDTEEAVTNTASSGSYTSTSSSDSESATSTLDDLNEAAESYFDGLKAIISKDTTSSKGESLSEDEPLSISSAATDGRTFANQIFTSTDNSATTKWAMQDAYDMTQSVTRLSTEYSSTRSEYYKAGQTANTERTERIDKISSNFKKVVNRIKNNTG